MQKSTVSSSSLASVILLCLSTLMMFVLISSSISSSSSSSFVASVLAQSTGASLVGSTVLDVDRTRLWIKDSQGSVFRPTNGSAPPLPKYADSNAFNSSIAYLAKHTALYDTVNERIMVFGGEQHNQYLANTPGYHPGRPLGAASNQVIIYDIRSNQWYLEPAFTPANVMPAPRMHHVAWFADSGNSAFGIPSTMIIYGGIGDDSRPSTFDAAFGDIWKYSNRSWSKLPFQAPRLYGHSAVTYNGKVYIFGGTSGRRYSNILYEADTSLSKNVSLIEIPGVGDVPRARAFHAAAISYNSVTGPEMIISGGHDGLNPMDDLYSFNLFTKRWSYLSRSKSDGARAYDDFDTVRIGGVAVPPLAHHSCTAHFPIVLCVGGSSTQPLINEYDIVLRRWIRSYTRDSSLPPLINSRAFLRVSDETGQQEMWLVGGISAEAKRFLPESENYAIIKTNFFTEQCPPNFVNPDYAAGRCFSCPSGTVVVADKDPHKCLACPPGTYERQGSCRKCPSGTYNPSNASSNVSSCITCPPGRFTIGDGADSIVDCITCPIGTYASPPECLPCPAGTYGSLAGQEGADKGCTPCPYGTYATPGSLSCTDCPAGSSSGPFIERGEIHRINLQASEAILPNGVVPGGCPNIPTPPTQVIAGSFFYVVVTLYDVGGPNFANPEELRNWIAYTWRDTNPQVTVEYNGTPSVMYYDCSDSVNLVPTCPSVVNNQTTPPRGRNVDDLNCHQWWRWATGFYLRFDEPTVEPVTLTIRSSPSSLRPLSFQFQVIAFGIAIEILKVEKLYVATQSIPTAFRALDLLNRFDPGASDSVTINVICNTGSPSLLINGVVSNTFTFIDGVFSANIGFTSRAEGCRFRYTRNGEITFDPANAVDYFSVQEGAYLIANTSSVNMTNSGWISVTCQMIDTATGVTMFGDNISTLRLDLVNNAFTQFWNVKPRDASQRVSAGVARWTFQIFSSYPVPSTLQEAFFTCNHINGVTTLLPPTNTNNFTLNGKVNGTEIRLNTDFGSWPTVVAANTSFKVSFERVDPLTGAVDGSQRLAKIQLELFNCPGVRLNTGNTSSPFITLVHGRGTAHVKLVGPDTTNCIVLVREIGQPDPEKRLKAFWTPYFDISTPTYLGHNGCAFSSCDTCQVGVGNVVDFVVSVYNADGSLATKDQRTIVQLQFTGNVTGAIETTGQYEKRVNDGNVTFSVQFLPTAVPTGLLFLAGYWIAEPVYNITYETVPVFREIKIQTGEAPVFYRNSIKPIYTCPMLLDQSATKMRLIGSMPNWIASGAYTPLSVEAITDFGTRAIGYNEPYTIGVLNCNGGITNDQEFRFKSFAVAETLFTTNFVTGDTFQNSLTNFDLSILYKTATHYTDGLKNCSIRVRSGTLPDLIVEGFDVNRVFKSCRMCAPGTWSIGANGLDLTNAPQHPGGCVKCMIGTFSTVSGAQSESECEVCSKGNGYVLRWGMHTDEGRTSCASCGLLNTTVGLPGGGACPAGSITQCNYVQSFQRGRLCRRCNLAQCQTVGTCAAGQFRLFCTDYTNQNDCEGSWNKGACFWSGAACSGASALCVNCPPGYDGGGGTNNWFFSACVACGPGQYSTEEAHTNAQADWQYEEWRCGGLTRYPRLCQGSGVFSCPNGTYQPARGASSNASCLTCPAGTYGHQVPAYNSQNCPSANCPLTDPPLGQKPYNNPYCTWAPGSCWRCPLVPRQTGGNDFMVAPIACTKCPAGTFNPNEGSSDPSACLPCRAGTYCPEGSVNQTLTDPNTSKIDRDFEGFTPQVQVSFEQSGTTMPCSERFTSDYPGYVLDGGFSDWVRRYYVVPTPLGSAFVNRWLDDSRHSPYHYDTQDRLGSATSGSLRCNATGCTVFQNISVEQEIPEEVVIRAWVYLRTPNASVPYTLMNASDLGVIYGNNPAFTFDQFAGFNVTFYSHWNEAFAQSISINKTIELSRVGTHNWGLIEAVFNPPWPIKIATFALESRGWYNLDVLFDDVALRPSANHICNCSTGFYYNASNPSRRCLLCPPGFMCAGGILKRCVNSWSTSAEPGCRRCRDNWMCDADGRGRLISCPLYTYKSNSTETCERCPNGYACQDGYLVECSGGRYGDGGLECKVCSPGYYSLPGSPRVECLRCPAGTTSNAMRTGCFQCPVDHYSPDGLQCLECPARTYMPFTGASECRPCDALFLQAWNYTVYRNSQQMLKVLPEACSCIEDWAWRIEAIHQISGADLGEASRSLSTKKTIRYTAGAQVGTHVFRVHLTSNDGATLQVAIITVDIQNRAPVAAADLNLVIVHPVEDIIYNLTALLFNDYDLELDNLFFATLSPVGAQYNATGLTITPDRRYAYVSLPKGFLGTATFSYSIMDQYRALVTDCLAPDCLLSSVVNVELTSKRVGPVAVNDFYDVLNGEVYSLDVLANDYDVDGDDMFVTAAAVSANGANPEPASTCSTGCAAACLGVAGCTCAFDTPRQRCWPSNNRPTTVQYTAPTTICGTDTFQYTVTTNDGTSTATVAARIRRCYCNNHAPPIYFQFVLDGTTGPNDFAHQLAYVDAVQKRTNDASGDFFFGIYVAGINQNIVPFQNTYIDTQDVFWPEGAENYPYNLGDAITQMPTVMNWAGVLPALPANRVLATIYISSKESLDSVVNPNLNVQGVWLNQNIAISVHPTGGGSNFNHALRLNPRYTGVFTSFDELISADTAAQNTMDELCAL